MGDRLQLHRISLRFQTPNVEHHFVKGTMGKLAFNICICSILCFAAAMLVSVLYALSLGAHGQKRVVQLITLISMGTICAVSFALMCISQSRACLEHISPFALEAVTVLYLCACSTVIIFLDHYYIAKIWALDPFALAQFFSDTRLLLIFVCVLTAGHVALPIRWCVLFVHEVFGVLLYAFCGFVVGSPEGQTNVAGNLLLFIFLTLCMSFGKRQLEYHERSSFQNFIAEKKSPLRSRVSAVTPARAYF